MKQRLPREIIIGDSFWMVKYVKKIPGEPKSTLGLCDPGDKTIYIKLGQTFEERKNSEAHEILHAISWEYNFYNIPHKYIFKFADGLVDFYMANSFL